MYAVISVTNYYLFYNEKIRLVDFSNNITYKEDCPKKKKKIRAIKLGNTEIDVTREKQDSKR